MTKETAIHLKYRQAFDLGKRSGHGKDIMCYFYLCNRIWGGLPADLVSSGVKSTDMKRQ